MTIERDVTTCCGCDEEAKVATPAGPLCRPCAADLAAEMEAAEDDGGSA